MQYRFCRPGAVRKLLDVLLEHLDGLGVFVFVPLLDGPAEVEMGGVRFALILRFMCGVKHAAKLACRHQFLGCRGARKIERSYGNEAPLRRAAPAVLVALIWP